MKNDSFRLTVKPSVVRYYNFNRDALSYYLLDDGWNVSISVDEGLPFSVFCEVISKYVSDQYGVNAILEVLR